MENTERRQLSISRTLKAPIELVWEVWTTPEHIAQWWGPNSFTNSIQQMDVREGGEWKLTMHGPDGTNYPNRSIYKEIVLHKKIVFEHFNPHFITTVVFEPNGEETHMSWTAVFDSEEILQTIIKAHKADEGMKQNIAKLENYISKLKPSL
ncbi:MULTISPECIES: SRPBCC domain-containing protein [Flavobacteriaceae]|uniref:SRPBCC domain-containing protein n=1 Tax=Flavobacteriaceae TaxID=49546 RepID=UPI00234AF30B|nr:SRPBCC domain-containing protein [Muricauda sp. SP22]MDC6364374.1 SRPBCC domain-containing protein [Muricauda sp. SP22]